MSTILLSALELGCIYALVALGLFLSFRVLDRNWYNNLDKKFDN